MIENITRKILEHRFKCIGGVIIIALILIYSMSSSNNPQPTTESVFKTTNNSPHKEKKMLQSKPEIKEIYVDIQGEVGRPGFYRLKNNARVFNLLQVAGGLKNNADRKQVNQAKKLVDQEQVYIPKIGENTTGVNVINTDLNGEDSNSEITKQININTASVDDLQNLSGVGPKKAEQIVQFREENGNFEKIEDLTKVSGIGEKTLESLKEQITV